MSRFVKLLIILLLLPVCTAAATTAASLSSTDTAAPGDTVTLTVSLSGNDIYGLCGMLSYDSEQVTCTGISPVIGGDWEAELNEASFLAYDDALESPVNGSAAVFALTFRVSNDLAPGTEIRIACTDIVASDGVSDIDLGTVSCCITVAAPQAEPSSTQPYSKQEEPSAETTAATVPQTQPPQTSTESSVSATAPAAEDVSADPAGEPLWTYILFALACILVGIGTGILLTQKFSKET